MEKIVFLLLRDGSPRILDNYQFTDSCMKLVYSLDMRNRDVNARLRYSNAFIRNLKSD